MVLTCPDKQLRYELGKLMYQDLGSVLNTCRIHEQIMKDIENKTKTSINSTTIAQEQEEITANLAYSKQYQQNNNRFQYNNQKQQFNQANKSAQTNRIFSVMILCVDLTTQMAVDFVQNHILDSDVQL